MKITTIGIDLAKNVFQVHGVDAYGKAVLKKQIKREEMAVFFANLAPWTDLLFGTYHCPRDQRHEVGLPQRPRKSYLSRIFWPHRDRPR